MKLRRIDGQDQVVLSLIEQRDHVTDCLELCEREASQFPPLSTEAPENEEDEGPGQEDGGKT